MPLAPAALAIVQNENGEVLLVKRCDLPVFVLPGGGIDPGESPEEAAIREVLEETGLVVSVTKSCAHYLPNNRLASETFVFICKVISGSLRISPESKEVGFFPLNRLPKEFFYIHAIWLKECLASPTTVRRSLTEVSYLSLALYFLKSPIKLAKYLKTRFFSFR